MRRFLLLLFAIFISITAFAQLEVKEGSFKEVPGFVNINPDENYQTDDNNLPFAVVKVRTENINEKQRRELKFSGNGGTFIMLEYKDGEVWVYLTAKYADYLKISHPDLSSTEYTFPYDLKPKCGYEMMLVNKSPNIDKNNYLIVKAYQQNAEIYIDDELMGTGYASKVVSIGEEHRYRVSCEDYYPKEGLVYFDKREDKEISVNLEPNFGYITIKSDPSGADIYVDEVKVGVTPYLMKKIKPGDHVIELRKAGYESYADMVTIQVREKNQQLENVMLERNENYVTQTVVETTKFTDGFSVSPDKSVYFSKGNLQYQASTNTWRFAEHQWDIIGLENHLISENYDGWIDLFGWGTSGYNDKNPWLKSNFWLTTEFGNGEMDITGTEYDWGVYNSISNGEGRNWRTLTKDEWFYVFNKRNTNSGQRYAMATVNEVKGVILLPDNWSGSTYRLSETNNFRSNIISKSEWADKFESNGAIFLPTAGFRNTSCVINDVGSVGYYWSASNYNIKCAYNLIFYQRYINQESHYLRSLGLSVRLVCDVEE